MKKTYEGSVKYKLRLEGKSCETLMVDIKTQGQSLEGNGGFIESEIKNEKEIELEVSLSSTACGEKMA